MQRRPTLRVPSEHRVCRLQRWLTLLLVWFVAHVAAIAPRHARQWVHRARRRALLLLECRALMQIAPTLGPPSPLKRCYDCLLYTSPSPRDS